jgi:hypothetical protein
LNILNSLIGSGDIENEFDRITHLYPETLKCIPILLAVRAKEIYAIDEDGGFNYSRFYPTGNADRTKRHILVIAGGKAARQCLQTLRLHLGTTGRSGLW